MTDATAEFFGALAERGHEPLLEKATGTVRFDLKDGKTTDRWLVTVDRGDLAVSRQNHRADLIVSTDKPLFDYIASGKTNALAALLRGAISVERDIQLSSCSDPGSSPVGGCAPWPRARDVTTRSATTSERSGRSTTRSSRGA